MIKDVVLQIEYTCSECGANYCTGLIRPSEWNTHKACDGDENTIEGCGHEWDEPNLVTIVIAENKK